MIKNERQYTITKAQARKFKDAIAAMDVGKAGTHPLLVKAQRGALESQLAELEAQLKEYETLRSGKLKKFRQSHFQNLPLELIRARIARGFTQKDLARKLGLKEQQIQRYEETEYASASLGRVYEVIKALDIEVREEVILDYGQGSRRN
jgi:ribosome-binding protein aMBF1 (putative translation factor)